MNGYVQSKNHFSTRLFIGLVLALAMLLCVLPAADAQAADIVASGNCGATGSNVTWTLDSDGLLTISGTGAMAGYSSGSAPWYSYRSSIKSVVIEDGVTGIGGYAFYYCRNLTSVTIPSSVTSIGSSAFYDCDSLTSVTIPDSVTIIRDYAFYSCDSLTSVTIPDRVTSIGSGAFYGCNSLTSVTIPDRVTIIRDYAFYGCTALTDVYYGSTCAQAKRIAYGSSNDLLKSATWHCTDGEFSYIDFGSCGENLIWGLDNVGVLTISGTGEMADYNYDGGPWGQNSSIKSVIIEDGVTGIGEYAFYNCYNLTSVTIPSSVTSIGKYAFCNCTSLTSAGPIGSGCSIEFGWTDAIPANAFYYCRNLTSVTIPSSVTSIGGSAFYNCSSLTSVTIPDGVTSIGNNTFNSCSSLTSVTIPDSVTSIGNNAFSYCSGLTSVTIPSSVTSIGNSAFYYCNSLTSVTIPASVTSIGSSAFYNCNALTDVYYGSTFAQAQKIISAGSGNIKSATWHCTDGEFSYKDFGTCGENLTWVLDNDGVLTISGIGEMANGGPWGQNGSIKSVVIEDGVTSIGSSAFNYCTSLTSVTIPDSVTRIGSYAFCECRNLTSVTIPDGVTSIEYDTFNSCSSLTSVTIPDSVTSIGYRAFCNCTALTDVYYGSTFAQAQKIGFSENGEIKSATWHCTDGEFSYIDFGTCGENLTWGLDNDGVLTISGTGEMADYNYKDSPWYDNSSIKSVVIEDGVTSIGSSAFNYCTSLTSVIIPDSVTSIGEYAFCSCAALTDVYYGSTCAQAKRIAYGSSNSFLKSATWHCTDGEFSYIDFGACGENLTWVLDNDGVLTISGTGEMASYNGGPWSDNSSVKSVVIEGGVTSIGNSAFYYCNSLTSVTIPDSVTSIGGSAFFNCYNLTSVTIPASVTSIGSSAFYNCDSLTSAGPIGSGCSIEFGWTDAIPANAFNSCSSLTSVVIPDSVTSIGSYAFEDCTSLTSVIIPDSVASIGYDAFSNCSSLTSITIPNWLCYCQSDFPSGTTVYGYSGTWLEGWLNNSGISFSSEGFGTAPNWIDGEYGLPEITYTDAGDPILHINSAADLSWLAQHVNAGNSMAAFKVVLDSDIDLSGKLWTPIGTNDSPYVGIFDGKGHTIKGMTVSMWSDDWNVQGGLFGNSSYDYQSTIKNVCLADAAITSNESIYPIIKSVSWGSTQIINCGAWGWASNDPYMYSDLAWSYFETPHGSYSKVYSYNNSDSSFEVTADYLRSDDFLTWIDSFPSSGLYDWVVDEDGDFPRMSAEPAVRTWEDVAEAVSEQNGVYEISSSQQLAYIATLANSGRTLSGKTIRLQDDIELTGLYWIPMRQLNADFDGNGHTISGLRVGNNDFPCRDNAGLIGHTNGSFSGLTVTGCVIATGRAGLLAAYSNNNVSDCHGSGAVSGGGDEVGGLVGYGYGSFTHCSFSGAVAGTSNVGGLIGSSFSSVSSCYAAGTVTGQVNVGGICGYSIGNIWTEFSDCYSVCDIINSGSNTGGIVGSCYRATARTCYAAGSVKGTENVGALFGNVNINESTIENCYFNKNGDYVIGGISLTPKPCGSGTLDSGVTALAAEQMRQQSSFAGFDFNTIWAIDSSTNDGMPYLRQDEAEYMPGDINGDGVLNNKDVTRLMRYIKYHDVDVEEAALDVNGDGVVNNKDVTRLMRYIKYGDVDIY